jgi:hypothetical protein
LSVGEWIVASTPDATVKGKSDVRLGKLYTLQAPAHLNLSNPLVTGDTHSIDRFRAFSMIEWCERDTRQQAVCQERAGIANVTTEIQPNAFGNQVRARRI